MIGSRNDLQPTQPLDQLECAMLAGINGTQHTAGASHLRNYKLVLICARNET